MTFFSAETAFYYLATASVASAILAVTRKNPVHSMLWVLALFLHVAGIFLLLNAAFLAAVQVIDEDDHAAVSGQCLFHPFGALRRYITDVLPAVDTQRSP